MLSSSKVLFLWSHFAGVRTPSENPQLGQNNCLTYNFLHCEFQISVLSSLKVTFWEGPFWKVAPPHLKTPKFSQNNCLTYNNFLHCEFHLTMLSNSKVFEKPFWEFFPPGGPPNLVKIIVSHTTSYIVSFNFLRQAV